MKHEPALFVTGVVMITLVIGISQLVISGPAIPSEVQNTTNSFHSCPADPFTVSLKGTQGFTAVVQVGRQSAANLALFDFVLPPGSAGNMTLLYQESNPRVDNPNKTQDVLRILYGRSNSSVWDIFNWPLYTKQLGEVNGTNPWVIVPDSEVGIHVNASRITPLGDYAVEVTYTMRVASSARMGTYHITLPQMCEGQFVTIGYVPYQTSTETGFIG